MRLFRIEKICFSLLLILSPFVSFGQKQQFTLEQIAQNGFSELNIVSGQISTYPRWVDNETVVVAISKNRELKKYNIKTKKYSDYKIENNYNYSDFNNQLELYKSIAKRLNCSSEEMLNPSFSPDNSLVAFIYKGNLYTYKFSDDKLVKLTTDGSDVVYNGRASWVYYEEILGRSSRFKAYWWSPDSKSIAFYHFDDSQVPMFPVYDISASKNQILETHYPMAGEKNPEVKIGFVNVNGGDIIWADFNEKDDQYFGIPFWNDDASKFIIPWMPRVQQDLLFYSVDPLSGKKESIYKEHQDSWINWPEQMEFVKGGFYMIRDFSNWEQIYFQSYDGKSLKQITSGKNWDINIIKIDQKNGYIYFTSKREISTREDFYKVNIKNGKITRLSEGEFTYQYVSLSEDNKYFTAIRSNAVTPYSQVVIPTDGSGKILFCIESKGENFEKYDIALPKMLYIQTSDGYTIPAKITLPVNFDENKKYPVIIYMYGGPNSPQVADRWSGVSSRNQWWAYQDVIQLVMDHRGSGHCGKEGLNFMYRNFFNIELKDFIEWAKYLKSLPYVNPDKIGINGFSYGGSMTTLCVTEGSDYFKYGIAGGGVYDYMLYDSHYTERYMDTPQRNPEGYARTKMSKRIAESKYKGDNTNMLMLTHGAADDNVHIQNTMSLALDLQKMGKQFEMMIYPTQLHGYRGEQGAFSELADYRFWYRYLLEKDVPETLVKSYSRAKSR